MSEPERGAEMVDPRLSAVPVRALGLVVVGMSLAVWWPAFQLGAWGEIFFDQFMAVWAGATGAFLVVMVHGPSRRRLKCWSVALLVPSVYILLNFAIGGDTDQLAVLVIAVFGVLVSLLGFPFTVWVLVRIIWPEISEELPGRARVVVFAIVAFVALAAFLLGVFENRFLTCEDYVISGNSTPPSCINLPTA